VVAKAQGVLSEPELLRAMLPAEHAAAGRVSVQIVQGTG
jgi:hypothetical protein